MKYKFKDGATIEGNLDQIQKYAKAIGETLDVSKLDGAPPRGYYLSESKGLVKISGMPDVHIRNALLKLSTKHFTVLQKEKGLKNPDFLKKYTSLTENPLVEDLFTELQKRK